MLSRKLRNLRKDGGSKIFPYYSFVFDGYFSDLKGSSHWYLKNVNIFLILYISGVIVLGKDEGFWLVHSVPKFPPDINEKNSAYDYPPTGHTYGQSMLCISLNTSQSANEIGLQMMYNQPFTYSVYVPKWVDTYQYEFLASAAREKFIKKAPFYRVWIFL